MDKRRSGEIINEIVASYIDDMYQNPNGNLENLREYAEENHVPVILKDAESFILMMLKIRNPKRILEIGTAIGYSSICFADKCNAHIVSLEANEDMYESAITNIHNFGYDDRIEVKLGDARESLLDLTKYEPFDLVFIDAAKSHYKEFWDLMLPLVTDDAMVICDNVLMKGMTASEEFDVKHRYKTSIRRMREFLDYINNLEYAETSILPIGDGVSVSVINK